MFWHWARKVSVNLHVPCFWRKQVKNSFLAQCSNYLKYLTWTVEMLNAPKIQMWNKRKNGITMKKVHFNSPQALYRLLFFLTSGKPIPKIKSKCGMAFKSPPLYLSGLRILRPAQPSAESLGTNSAHCWLPVEEFSSETKNILHFFNLTYWLS